MLTRYDHSRDVIRKALRGRDLAPATAAVRAGMDPAALVAWLAEKGPEPPLEVLAGVLGLGAEALAALDSGVVAPPLPEGIRQLVLPFDDETVNAWWIESAGETLLIDGGPDPGALISALAGRRPDRILLTHPHGDHLGGLRAFAGSGPEILRGADLPPGGLALGGGRIHAQPLPGHHPEAWGFIFRDLEGAAHWAAVGDALFMGSMGGCADARAFQEACASLAGLLRTLDPGTLLLTGHGPPSTVAAEWTGNAFAPCWPA